MPTVASSTDVGTGTGTARLAVLRQWCGEAARAAVDVRHLLAFRAGTVRHRAVMVVTALIFIGVSFVIAIAPHYAVGAGLSGPALDLLVLMPTAFAGFLLLAIVSAIASGGGRELLARDQGVAYPISPTTDHLGALLLAPLNIAWILQAWVLLFMMAFVTGRGNLLPAQIGLLLWLAVATAIGQVVAWLVEWVRRTRHGPAIVRTAGLAALGAGVTLQLTDNLVSFLEASPTLGIVAGLVQGWTWRWLITVLGLLVLLAGAIVLGGVPAHLAARQTPRDEARNDGGRFAARPMPRSTLAALIRMDRGSIWRALPMRRGIAVLAIGPGLVALLGGLDWPSMTILPGLVASGGALIFGVNAWCLDTRGVLWRESLPVPPWQVFAARAWTLGEFLVAASLVTLVLAGLRAGVPTAAELTALLCTWVVVVLQVVSTSMRWSARAPHAVDLRSARAIPAPPFTMVGYSTKLAVTTTLSSLIFSALARTDHPEISILAATPFVLWSVIKLMLARDAWVEPVSRARVAMTVAG